ncbi:MULTISPECIES: PilN domain-containing protein [Enterobacter]|jgi:pilus assembly protein HofN|uniref:PilN domain-containing protein n=1 Tax=Enterobacter asburiae TaxID=61645 RepID=A0AAQ0J7Z6_ENTAS|nr:MULTISPECIES: PilN domain-containing protein [Enterobacter]MDU4485735.1 PilN domain-containing protein [Enterobacter sp.]QBB07101.1 pilus assembly protein HofN [Enterobacter cloacae]EGQ5319884.1 pilus assembly protein HofN [Enterobacter asburiae]EHN8760051.1 PilN domain-containing protein [Enterobacter asburiae]EKS6753216.1 PilN domain-containing protein [Enterobacter asburiae]
MSLMNFLPWRQQRRARCLRFWGAMCVGTVLLMFAVIFCLRINPVMRLHALQTELTGMQTVQHALASRQKLASQAQKPAQTRQQRAWQPVLESLSRATPSQVWLTELRYQPPALMLTGYAITLPALSALRDALGQIAGFTPGTAGELRQDSQGRWMFTLHLKSEG